MVDDNRLLAKVLTVSDGVAAGTREDRSGEALRGRLVEAGYDVVEAKVTADGIDSVAGSLRRMCNGFNGLVVTTGGTGFGPRDLTPEGTRAAIDREAPGVAEAIRTASSSNGRPFGMLTRGIAGTLGMALVVNVPGSSSGAIESLDAVLPAVSHAIDLLGGGRPH